MEISGTAALVTGGASGLGAATAAALAERGATVFGLDLHASIDKASERLGGDVTERLGGDVTGRLGGSVTGERPSGVTLLPADVTSEDDVRDALAQIEAGRAPLRIVVNCAGIGAAGRILGKNGPHDLELFRTVLMVNVLGTFNVMRLAAEVIARTEADDAGQRGVVVNTASIAAFEGQIGQIAYSASKGGVVGMTVPAARDLAQHGIRVNTIAPGIVDTPMLAGVSDEYRAGLSDGVPFPKRLAQPAEYAQLAAMIVEHDYLNGETIRMDGALRMAPR